MIIDYETIYYVNMYPNLFGINDFSYILCLALGILLAFLIVIFFLKQRGATKNDIIDFIICGCFTVVLGIIFAVLFENLYEWIELKENYHWVFKMTFYGGLFGGTVGFILSNLLLKKKFKSTLSLINVLKIAPTALVLAHSIGRIGCFLAGCCYGKVTTSWIGLECAQDLPGVKVVPTQLIEALFLLILFCVMIVLNYKEDFKYNLVIYGVSYSIFRFIIEFYRNDPRGVAFALSPSQIFSICLLAFSIALPFILRFIYRKYESQK